MKEFGLDGGRYIVPEHYFTQNLAGEDVQRVIVDAGKDRLRSKQLSVLIDTDISMWPRLICFPTSLAVGINVLSGQKLFGYSRFDGLDIGRYLLRESSLMSMMKLGQVVKQLGWDIHLLIDEQEICFMVLRLILREGLALTA